MIPFEGKQREQEKKNNNYYYYIRIVGNNHPDILSGIIIYIYIVFLSVGSQVGYFSRVYTWVYYSKRHTRTNRIIILYYTLCHGEGHTECNIR